MTTDLRTMLQGAALTLQSRGPYALWEESHRCVEGETEWMVGPWMRYDYPEDFEDWTDEAQSAWYEDAPQYPSPDLFVVNVQRKHANGRTMMVQQALSPLLILHMNGDIAEFIRRDVERLFTRCAETA